MTRKKRFGKNLAEWRKMCNLSQRDLAQRVGVSASYISKIENGTTETMPSYELLLKFQDALFLDKETILDVAGYYDPKRLDEHIEKYPDTARILRGLYEKD